MLLSDMSNLCYFVAAMVVRKTTILVKKGEEAVINTIEQWLNNGDNADEKQIDAWSDAGLVFRSTPLGVRAMHLAESKGSKTAQTIRKPSALKYALDMYIQAGTERYVNPSFLPSVFSPSVFSLLFLPPLYPIQFHL